MPPHKIHFTGIAKWYNLPRADPVLSHQVDQKPFVSLPVFAIAWSLRNPRVSTVILGGSKVAQLEENLKAVEAQDLLTPEVTARVGKTLTGEKLSTG